MSWQVEVGQFQLLNSEKEGRGKEHFSLYSEVTISLFNPQSIAQNMLEN